MRDDRLTFEPELANLDADRWTERMEELSEEHGYFQSLGQSHFAAFFDAGPKLIVTFEQRDIARKTGDGMTRGLPYCLSDGFSHLAIVSHDESWFRDPAIYGYFDRLVDDGFFEDFDSVLFYGAHSGAYAATAYSVAAPGARVLAIRPQASLDPAVAGWDNRYLSQRKHDFTSRYGYGPDMIDAADRAYIAFDPFQRFDAIHAAMFTRSNVTALPCTGLGWKIDAGFDAMDIHDAIIRFAMDGMLTRKSFARLMRARRDYPVYLRTLFNQALLRDHPVLAANVCAFVLRQGHDTFFAGKLKELMDQGHHPTNPVEFVAA